MTGVNAPGEHETDVGTDLGRDARQVGREVTAMVLLAATAVVVFLATRQLASWERGVSLEDASRWYSRGNAQLDANALEDAVVSLRRAHNKNPGSRSYAIAFAHALSASGRSDDAARVLLSLRESSPEDPQLNLELARLAAGQDRSDDATRYFHSALYGVWPEGRDGDRRAARVELVRFLLRHDEHQAAVAELIALTTNLPDVVTDRTQAGQLMLEAGDPQRALAQFRRALVLAPKDSDALSGAGEASFLLADYAGARRYLQSAPALSPRLVELRDLLTQVLERDPLATKLPLAERRRRLVGLLAQEMALIDECRTRAQDLPPGSVDRLDALRRDLAAIDAQFHLPAVRDAGEMVDATFDTLVRTQQATAEMCGEPAERDNVLVLIRRSHEGRSQ